MAPLTGGGALTAFTFHHARHDPRLMAPLASLDLFTGLATGGEDRKFVVSITTGVLLLTEEYVDKPFLKRLHSGEVFGDGGLVGAMFWALALASLTISGVAIFWRMRRKDVTGWRRYFF